MGSYNCSFNVFGSSRVCFDFLSGMASSTGISSGNVQCLKASLSMKSLLIKTMWIHGQAVHSLWSGMNSWHCWLCSARRSVVDSVVSSHWGVAGCSQAGSVVHEQQQQWIRWGSTGNLTEIYEPAKHTKHGLQALLPLTLPNMPFSMEGSNTVWPEEAVGSELQSTGITSIILQNIEGVQRHIGNSGWELPWHGNQAGEET